MFEDVTHFPQAHHSLSLPLATGKFITKIWGDEATI